MLFMEERKHIKFQTAGLGKNFNGMSLFFYAMSYTMGQKQK